MNLYDYSGSYHRSNVTWSLWAEQKTQLHFFTLSQNHEEQIRNQIILINWSFIETTDNSAWFYSLFSVSILTKLHLNQYIFMFYSANLVLVRFKTT